MDELVLALFQGPGFALEGPLFLLLALMMGGYLAHALWSGRMGSGEQLIGRAEQPRRFRRAILTLATFTLFLLALAAFAFLRAEEFRANVPLAMPFFVAAFTLWSLHRGFAFEWSRAEQPRAFWCAIAVMVLYLAVTVASALDRLGVLG
jgi:hypothetical protein